MFFNGWIIGAASICLVLVGLDAIKTFRAHLKRNNTVLRAAKRRICPKGW